jgi:hypothetical protein
MKVNVKWGKELFSDIDVDTTQPPMVFKSQLFTLSGVPPERQKVLIKGGQLKDDEWGKQQPKEGMTIMMMGSADEIKVEAPTNAPKFVEDLPGVLLLLLPLLLSFFPSSCTSITCWCNSNSSTSSTQRICTFSKLVISAWLQDVLSTSRHHSMASMLLSCLEHAVHMVQSAAQQPPSSVTLQVCISACCPPVPCRGGAEHPGN